ncbi:ABC-2 type transport system ATP-binding protein [Thermosporothrix hazakensis]|jgi:ABC-2 type transport system ATP-binding protein|uniref:ABC-2 type transport system ATP-binding protein n=2 Tax=Thermosporothrix TaxID=768650 RepID=A0A326U5V3_THEHA|nr:ABC transporter ATP-binding protein [Thermosporothrix hazakensis]PZW27153.1 ABC-2 type transport system ATP-binding protein [Thermosporothrix hazakensis]BBH88019.1 daunorubicin resistance protein DrrA family ABC transporter ATP-binding protein [Thermosporothrix sp. COM3]GCE50437.1 daunorubicin resistance protein DrrA family ABC transporter ATP-binding protein [Thermosporothrix hazakensis]
METTPNKPAIIIEQISKTYYKGKKQEINAVRPLNLTVPAGQIFGFLGPNGAGKTTTIKMICGLIRPTTGHIYVNGYDVIRERWNAMRQIGAVLEGTRNIHWRLSAWQNLLYFGRLKGCYPREIKQRGTELLHDLDLWDRRHTEIREFSRGMQQKVAIACALIADPPVILLDEPTLGLDIEAARVVKEWIWKLAHERGKTIVLTTHQLDIAQALCHRIAIIQKGSILADQPLDVLLDKLGPGEFYSIKIKGTLTSQQRQDFPAFTIETEDENTILSGRLENQTMLQETLARLIQLNLNVLSMSREEPNLEDIFIDLIDGARKGDTHEHHLTSALQ